jgi:hypothetical protein
MDRSGRQQVLELDLERPQIIVGRHPDCDLVSSDASVSRRHCVLALENGHYRVSDLGSANGTLVNDVRISHRRLKSRDIVRCGSLILQFVDDHDMAAPPPPAHAQTPAPEPPPPVAAHSDALESENQRLSAAAAEANERLTLAQRELSHAEQRAESALSRARSAEEDARTLSERVQALEHTAWERDNQLQSRESEIQSLKTRLRVLENQAAQKADDADHETALTALREERDAALAQAEAAAQEATALRAQLDAAGGGGDINATMEMSRLPFPPPVPDGAAHAPEDGPALEQLRSTLENARRAAETLRTAWSSSDEAVDVSADADTGDLDVADLLGTLRTALDSAADRLAGATDAWIGREQAGDDVGIVALSSLDDGQIDGTAPPVDEHGAQTGLRVRIEALEAELAAAQEREAEARESARGAGKARKAQRDAEARVAELESRVTDYDDIRTQRDQMAQNLRSAHEKVRELESRLSAVEAQGDPAALSAELSGEYQLREAAEKARRAAEARSAKHAAELDEALAHVKELETALAEAQQARTAAEGAAEKLEASEKRIAELEQQVVEGQAAEQRSAELLRQLAAADHARDEAEQRAASAEEALKEAQRGGGISLESASDESRPDMDRATAERLERMQVRLGAVTRRAKLAEEQSRQLTVREKRIEELEAELATVKSERDNAEMTTLGLVAENKMLRDELAAAGSGGADDIESTTAQPVLSADLLPGASGGGSTQPEPEDIGELESIEIEPADDEPGPARSAVASTAPPPIPESALGAPKKPARSTKAPLSTENDMEVPAPFDDDDDEDEDDGAIAGEPIPFVVESPES